MAVPVFNQALQIFYKDKSKFTIPKKGTKDYEQVIKIMNEIKSKNTTATTATTAKSATTTKSTKSKSYVEKPLNVSMPSG